MTTHDDFTFAESIQEWTARTGGTLAERERLARKVWDRIRFSDHYHGGTPCREAKECDRHLNNRRSEASP